AALGLGLLLGVSPALAAACPWPEAMGQRLLDRRVGTLSLSLVEVEKAAAEICDRSDLPLSFVQAPSHRKISLELHDASVRQALDAVLAQAPEYRYGFVAERLILYPQEPVWQTRLEDISLGPGPRLQVARSLAAELARRLPFFAHLSGAFVLGNGKSYTYRDIVTVRGPGSLLDLFVQLLGSRPGTFFIFSKPTEARANLSVSSKDQLRSLKLVAPATTLRNRGETVNLRVIGTLRTGGDKDVSAGACGTVYTVSDERVLSVSPDGLVSAHASGKAEVTASNEHQEDRLTLTVTLPETAPGAPTGQQREQSSASRHGGM
ncbi:MAG TPA: Ig-like domain-containing protein, partial [Thermoanaerobaculia bacterium]|nr:Ig-like domain-containing protein [Thermoanaerobaculia bacterium]